MKTTIELRKSKKTGKKYLCLCVGEVLVFLDSMQIMKILDMTPNEISFIMSQQEFIYDISNERRLDC